MRDETAIRNFQRVPQGGDRVVYFFGDTTVVAEEWRDRDGILHLRPVSGDQVLCGEWNDLEEDSLLAYCELIEDEIRRRNEECRL